MRGVLPGIFRACFCAGVAAALAACGGGGGYPSSSYGNPGGSNLTIASVAITGNATSVAVGSTVTLTAAAYNATGGVVAATFSWASNNPAAATVGASSGVVTGLSAGTATITASAGGYSGTRVITVTGANQPPPLVAQISMPGTAFEPNAVTIGVGGTVTWVFSAITHNVTFAAATGAPANIGDTSNQSVARTFNTAGTFNFSCTIHSGMYGAVTVR